MNNLSDEEKERLKELQEEQLAFYKWGKFFFMAVTGAVALFVFMVAVALVRGPMGI